MAKDELPEHIKRRYQNLIIRRSRNEPTAYLLHSQGFYGREFYVDSHVLIPRPETELLVEETLKAVDQGNLEAPKILEVGTGSGCIAISVALERSGGQLLAVDISPEALIVARINARRFGTKNIQFIESDLYAGMPAEFWGDFDIIVSNPPYIATGILAGLQKELEYEPQKALDGGDDGLRIIRPLVEGAIQVLKPGGAFLIEIGFDQGVAVRKIFEETGFQNIDVIPDLNQKDRVVKGVKSGSI